MSGTDRETLSWWQDLLGERDGERLELPAVCVELEGIRVNVRSRVDQPERFYESFLRDTEDLRAEQLADILHALVTDCTGRWLGHAGSGRSPEALASELDVLLGSCLASCGLELIRLELLDRVGMETRQTASIA